MLSALDTRPVRTRAALADAIGADKSRIIAVLDELENAGLLRRTADPDDRRARVIAITGVGVRKRRAAQTAIQRNEERLLRRLDPADRAALLRTLAALADLATAEQTPPAR